MSAVIVALPFLAAVTGLLFGRRVPRGPAPVAVFPTALATLLALVLAVAHLVRPRLHELRLSLIETGGLPISVGFREDGLSVVVGLMVCSVALAVQVYSVDYMRGDPRYSSYAAFVSLFTAAMLLVVYAGDLLLLYVGWEVMGFCSYALIGHYWHDRPTSTAAVKAFLVTRLGDVGFLIGIFVLGTAAGSFEIGRVVSAIPDMSGGVLAAGTLLLVFGMVGKSAQFPLHTWLPDAMAGPTPISALIHAATMVAAGIFIVARVYPVFFATPITLAAIGVLAAVTMVGSALVALVEEDIKRVIAYSTISSLGFMAAGLAAGGKSAAIFHLLTHGAFKALLFLCAGAVIVGVGSNLLRDMGGLRLAFPITFPAMTIGWAALVGLPPLAGFFSKDSIVVAIEHAVAGEGAPLNHAVAWLLYLASILTVALTAAYALRAWLRTFFGPAARGEAAGTPAVSTPPELPRSEPPSRRLASMESPAMMRWPIVALAIPSVLLGFLGLGAPELRPEPLSTVTGLVAAGAGLALVYLAWRDDPAADPARILGPLRGVGERAFYVNELYRALFVRPVLRLARLVVGVDDRLVDSAVEGSGKSAVRLGGLLRVAHNGNPQLYVTGVLAGVLLFAVGMVVFA